MLAISLYYIQLSLHAMLLYIVRTIPLSNKNNFLLNFNGSKNYVVKKERILKV